MYKDGGPRLQVEFQKAGLLRWHLSESAGGEARWLAGAQVLSTVANQVFVRSLVPLLQYRGARTGSMPFLGDCTVVRDAQSSCKAVARGVGIL